MKTPRPEELHLLIIDDEPGIRKMMALDLMADGYHVDTAEDGLKGLECFDTRSPDIVITDIKMPGIDGIEVLRRIKARNSQTEVIVVTGHGDMDLAVKSLQLDASDFITKPVSPDALAVALDRAAQRLAMKRTLWEYTHLLEEKVAAATEKLLASERLAAIGQTVSSLVHSIKNMLCGLKGGTYMIRQARDKGDAAMMDGGMEMLSRNITRVDRLVRDLLTLSKSRTPLREKVEAACLVRDAVELVGSEAARRGVELALELPPPDLLIQVDRQAILDGLANLISNAVDAAGEKTGGRVQVRAEDRGGEVAYVVEDNGPGLDEEALTHIFEGFYSSKGASGTGLGLMVTCKNAAEHGGGVEYDNRPGKGVTFRLVLPKTGPGQAAEEEDLPDQGPEMKEGAL